MSLVFMGDGSEKQTCYEAEILFESRTGFSPCLLQHQIPMVCRKGRVMIT